MKRTMTTICVVAAFLAIENSAFATLSPGLIAYYPFDGSGIDASGNGNDATVFGATPTEDRFGNPESAYCFDGIDDYIEIPNTVKPGFPITVSAWVRQDSIGLGPIFRNDQHDSSSYRYGISLQYTEEGHLAAHVFEGFSTSSNRVDMISNDPLVTPGDWHHFAVVFDDYRDIQLFWDDQEVEGYYRGSGSGLTYSNSPGAVGLKYDNTGEVFFRGCIDDIRVYNSAVPEPATICTLGFGSLALLRHGRRKLR